MADRGRTSLYYYKKKRRKFAAITYFLTFIFLLLAFIQWNLFYWFREIHVFFVDYYWVGIIFFILGLLLISIFIFFENLRFSKPINWIIAFLIVEFIVIGVTSLIVRHFHYHFLMSFLIWAVVLALFICCGSFLPHDLTLDVVVLFVLAVLALIGAIYFLMLYLVANAPYTFFIHRAFIVLSIVLFVMYHAQIINGGRFAEMRTQDYLLAALILFHDFLLMFMFTFHLAPRWSDSCDAQKNASNWIVVDHWHTHLPPPEAATQKPKSLILLKRMMSGQATTLDYI